MTRGFIENKELEKKSLIYCIDNMLKNIEISPELFSDGIDEEIIELLLQIKKYIMK